MGLGELTGMVVDGVPNVASNVLPSNLSVTDLPPEIISRIAGLITILQAAGIIFIVYMAFLITRWILNFKRYRKVNKMYSKMEEMDKKLDLLLDNKEIKKKKEKKKEKTKKK